MGKTIYYFFYFGALRPLPDAPQKKEKEKEKEKEKKKKKPTTHPKNLFSPLSHPNAYFTHTHTPSPSSLLEDTYNIYDTINIFF